MRVPRVARLLALLAAFAIAASPFAARGHALALQLAPGDICFAAGGSAPVVPGSHDNHCECCTSAAAPPPFVRPVVVAALRVAPAHAPVAAWPRADCPASFLARAPPTAPVVPS